MQIIPRSDPVQGLGSENGGRLGLTREANRSRRACMRCENIVWRQGSVVPATSRGTGKRGACRSKRTIVRPNWASSACALGSRGKPRFGFAGLPHASHRSKRRDVIALALGSSLGWHPPALGRRFGQCAVHTGSAGTALLSEWHTNRVVRGSVGTNACVRRSARSNTHLRCMF